MGSTFPSSAHFVAARHMTTNRAISATTRLAQLIRADAIPEGSLKISPPLIRKLAGRLRSEQSLHVL